MKHALLLVAITLTALVSGSTALSSTAVAPEGVSSVSYSPKPLYNDLSYIRVRFTTTGRARPGWGYGVDLETKGPAGGCAYVAASNTPLLGGSRRVITGAPGTTYTVTLWAEVGGGFWCAGPAELWVGTRTLKHPGYMTIYRKVWFRIFRAP